MKKSSNTNILLIYTGGTIGMVKDTKNEFLKPFNFTKIRERISELEQLDCEISTISFDKPIDSSDMNINCWVEIVSIIEKNYADFDGFVVLHGSDTMAYSASALSFMLENLSKPVIFTGSQLPIGDLRTDAKENLITAIQIACLNEDNLPIIQEVCLYFEYKLYRANRTTKINAEHFQAFASANFPPLVESGVHLRIRNNLLLPNPTEKPIFHKKMDNNVVVLKMFPSINQNVVQSIVSIPNLRGIVLETYGSGNTTLEIWFIKTLENAIKSGIKIVNVTQCVGGQVIMGKYQNSSVLKEIGVLSGKDSTTESALTKLMFLLGQNISDLDFKTIFEGSLRGEIT